MDDLGKYKENVNEKDTDSHLLSLEGSRGQARLAEPWDGEGRRPGPRALQHALGELGGPAPAPQDADGSPARSAQQWGWEGRGCRPRGTATGATWRAREGFQQSLIQFDFRKRPWQQLRE